MEQGQRSLQFEIEKARVDVPEHFRKFSVMIDTYLNAFSSPESMNCDNVIPLENFKKDSLDLILAFFEELKANPPFKEEESIGRKKGDRILRLSFSQVGLDDEEGIDGAVMEEDEHKVSDNNKSDCREKKMSSDETKEDADYGHLSANIKIVTLPQWAVDFFDKVAKEHLFQATILANYLLANQFIEHAAFYIANKLKTLKSVKEMREYLNTKADFSEGEFDLLANDSQWYHRLRDEGLLSKNFVKPDFVGG